MSQSIIAMIEEKYRYIKELQKIDEVSEIIYDIYNILSDIILDKNEKPREEFNNDTILKPFYNVKHLVENADFDIPDSTTKLDSNKKEHISLRLCHETNKQLDCIAEFYGCNKSNVIPLLLLGDKDVKIDSTLPECFCYLTDIKNYFYENHIDNVDFESEYDLLWKKLV